ncbi:MAG: alpha/beta hydrolase [Candidatus Methylumidiphilus sp.]
MKPIVFKSIKYALVALSIIAVTLLGARAYVAQRGLPLEPWHRFVPHELSVEELNSSDWDGYLKAEAAIFDSVRTEITQQLNAEERVPVNRYFEGSPIYPGRFPQDWNRSYVLEPEGKPVGAVVFLHGLTDSPYSLRHIARRYRAHGYVSVAIRLPAHGTVPGALTKVRWQEWQAATRLAVREARRRAGPSAPLHIVGFSNGGALALKYALDALDDDTLPRPDRLVLISPMIGLTGFARFAGLAGLPAILPPFAKAAWLSVIPEFNPFKYNSFPINGARQAHQLTVALEDGMVRNKRDGRLGKLPPVLTFQSLIDFTVSTSAVVSALHALLPQNGSELVLFDMNRAAKLSLLLRPDLETKLTRILPPPPRSFRTVIITNANPGTGEVVKVTEAGTSTEQSQPLGLSYPADIFSLSHVALPFPPDDALYGMQPGTDEDFGINLGSIASRGERGALIMSLDGLLRTSSNPFFSYLVDRIEEGITTTPAPTHQ